MTDLEELMGTLSRLGVYPQDIQTDKTPFREKPSTAAGVYSLSKEGTVPGLSSIGATVQSKSGRKNAVLYQPGKDDAYVRGHEYEHVLANQGLDPKQSINSKFDDLIRETNSTPYTTRVNLVKDLISHAPHFVEQYGLNPKEAESGYFSKKMYDYQGGSAGLLLAEQFASLSSLEQKTGKRLVDDPYIRKNVLKTPELREAYDAVTGLRQTRLDSKDLPPYTRVPERNNGKGASPNLSLTDYLMKLLK
jgi:hypothetical protein